MISCCLREALNPDLEPTYKVEARDIKAAEEITTISLRIREMIDGSLKSSSPNMTSDDILHSAAVVTSEAVEAMSDEEREKILVTGAYKIKRIFDEAESTSRELLISTYNNKQLWPKMNGVDGTTFIKVISNLNEIISCIYFVHQVLVFYGLVKETKVKRGNRKEAAAIQVLGRGEAMSDDLKRIFKILHDSLQETKSIRFDPFGLFAPDM